MNCNEINLFFPYYDCGEKDRQKEIDLCLKRNIENTSISKLVLLIDDKSTPPYNDDKVQIVHLDERPTYKLWLELTSKLKLAGVSLLCNSDIYFDESISRATWILKPSRSFLALSRWELIDGHTQLHSNPHWSQDVWGINCNNLFSKEMLKTLDFPMGVPRCDNKVAYLFAIQGWGIKNPCKFFKSIHVHETQMRTYHKKLDTRILGGVAYIHPGKTETCNANLELDIWSVSTVDIKSVAINKSIEKWMKEESQPESLDVRDSLVTFEVANIQDALKAIKNGEKLFRLGAKFEIYKYQETLYFKNIYNLRSVIKTGCLDDKTRFLGFIPPVINTYILDISTEPQSDNDINFWQYPCSTEQQAYDNNLNLKYSEHIDYKRKTVFVYVPVPWATYIDRKDFSSAYLDKLTKVIADYYYIAELAGYKLKVHTVCQHIHWRRILPIAKKLGVTDLHLSHKYSKSDEIQKEDGYCFDLHGWPLIAVNYVIPERSEGMERKAVRDKTLLASFIGAHMNHYRDDSRVKLFEAAKKYGGDDVFVDLGDEWHFNKVVYEEQVLNKEIASHHIDEHHQRTFRYNSILSDSAFSLCPEGAGPNTLRFWESIAVGAIPVLFSDDLSVLENTEAGQCVLKNCILWNNDSLDGLFEALRNMEVSNLESMRKNLIELYKVFEELRCFDFERLS